jgi:transcriptional regulator with PAS, ATPase and Fis domain
MRLAPGFRQEGSLRDIFEAIPHAVMVVDEKRRIHSVNSFLARIIGLQSSEVAGKGSGQAFGCLHAFEECATLGNSDSCKRCELRMLVASAFETNAMLSRNVPMQVSADGAVCNLAFKVHARQVEWGSQRFAVLTIEDAAKLASLKRPQSEACPRPKRSCYQLIGKHPSMLKVYEFIEEVARTQLPVLIQGETGTGKELVALAIHQASTRAEGHFVPVNCAALPEGLLENELFGHVKGAFTGATGDRKGRFQLADGGSLMLDEIGELSPSLQVKLLRVLQERRFERLGSNQSLQMDFRVISATNKELEAEVKSGRFRADLFYRLCVAVITLPPLRERRSDIPLLVDSFLSREARKTQVQKPILWGDAMSSLMNHDWPGNVRELQNVIQFAMMKSRDGVIGPECFPSALGLTTSCPVKKKSRTRKLKKDMVADALHKVDGNRLKAARLLNVSRSTLYRFMDEVTNPSQQEFGY